MEPKSVTKLLVVDDVLTYHEHHMMKSYFAKNFMAFTPMPARWLDKDEHTFSPLRKILDIVGETFDLSSMIGCEYWGALRDLKITEPDWHVDKDEVLLNKTGQLVYPLCSIVYYVHIENMVGGKLYYQDESRSIVPKTNRLVAFSPKQEHGVEPFTGKRFTLGMNPWDRKPDVSWSVPGTQSL